MLSFRKVSATCITDDLLAKQRVWTRDATPQFLTMRSVSSIRIQSHSISVVDDEDFAPKAAEDMENSIAGQENGDGMIWVERWGGSDGISRKPREATLPPLLRHHRRPQLYQRLWLSLVRRPKSETMWPGRVTFLLLSTTCIVPVHVRANDAGEVCRAF